MSADDLLAALDPEQREVATALRGPVRVLAGAGTGKTRAITHRIAYGVASGVYNPMEVLAVTFTTRAAGEMRAPARATLGPRGVQARTFHSAALRQVRYFWPRVYGGEPPQLIESKLGLVAGAARRNRVETDQARLRDVASEIEWSKVSNVRPDDYAASRRGGPRGQRARPRDGRAPVRQLRGPQARAGAHGHGGRLLCGAAILAEDERVAAEVRRQYRWFVVDEFQDVIADPGRAARPLARRRDEICVVGDPAQTIYSFRVPGAYLTDFPRTHEGTTSVSLVRNYRSTPQVIEVANKLLAGTGSVGVQLRAQREAGPP